MRAGSYEWMRPAIPWLPLIPLLAVSVGVRAYRLDDECMWLDEYLSYGYIHVDTLSQFLGHVRSSNSPTTPLYFVIEYLWFHWIYSSDIGLRWLSILIGQCTLVLVYEIARRCFGMTAAAVAAMLVALSPIHVYYDQEMRMYSLTSLLACASVYTLWLAATEGRARTWILHVLANIALVWTHPFGSFLWVAEGIWLAWFWRRHLLYVALWVAGHGLIGSIPFRYMRLSGIEKIDSQMSWVGRIDWRGAIDFFCWPRVWISPWMHYKLPWLQLLALLPVIAVSVVLLLRWRAAKAAPGETTTQSQSFELYLLLMLWLTAPPLVLLLESILYAPAMVTRYVLYASPALFMQTGWAISMLRGWRNQCIAMTALLVVLLLANAQIDRPLRLDRWAVSAKLQEEADPSDLVIVLPEYDVPIARFYSGGRIFRLVPLDKLRDLPATIGRMLNRNQRAWVWSSTLSGWRELEHQFDRRHLVATQFDFPGAENSLLCVEWERAADVEKIKESRGLVED